MYRVYIYLFSRSIPFTVFAILFFEVPMWSKRFSHPKETTPESSKPQKVAEGC